MLIQKRLLILAAKYFGAYIFRLLLVNLVTFTVLIMSTKVSLYTDVVLCFFFENIAELASEASVRERAWSARKKNRLFFSSPTPTPLRWRSIGTLRSEDSDGRESVVEKVNSCSFNLHRDYSKSLTFSNVGEPS